MEIAQQGGSFPSTRPMFDYGDVRETDYSSNQRPRWQRSSSALFPDLEAELLIWVTERRLQGYGVSTTEIRVKALKIAKRDPKARDFKASTNWCYSFLKRHNLSIRRRTVQPLSEIAWGLRKEILQLPNFCDKDEEEKWLQLDTDRERRPDWSSRRYHCQPQGRINSIDQDNGQRKEQVYRDASLHCW